MGLDTLLKSKMGTRTGSKRLSLVLSRSMDKDRETIRTIEEMFGPIELIEEQEPIVTAEDFIEWLRRDNG